MLKLLANFTDDIVKYEEFVPKNINLINKNGIQLKQQNLSKKYVIVYVSAGFCGPCKKLTPKLKKYVNKYGGKVDVILISLDRCEDQYNAYISTLEDTNFSFMPYFYKPNLQVWKLSKRLVGGRGKIPLLVMYDENKKFIGVVNNFIENDADGKKNYTPWVK